MTAKTKFSLGVIAASVLALITGCGGGGGGGTTPPVQPPADTRAPVVTSFTAQVLGTTTKIDIMKAGAVDVPKNAFFVAEVDEVTQGCPTDQPVVKTFDKIEASFTCAKNSAGTGSVWTIVPTASLADGAKITITLGPTDAAGNQGSLATSFTIAVPPPAAATVTLAAPPNPITVGDQATLTWVTKNAANCLATGGWTGSVSNTGGTQVVAPTVTTTYSIECWNAANVSTGVVSTTVTVTPVTAVTYPAAVVVFGSNWVYRVDPTVPGGVVPIANRSGHDFYSYGFRATALPNCQIQVSGLDNYTFAPFQFFWDRKKEEFTLDTTGTAPPRLMENYTFAVLPDSNYPGTLINVVVGDERFFVLNTAADYRTLQYQKGAAPAVALGTFPLGIKAILYYPACTAQ